MRNKYCLGPLALLIGLCCTTAAVGQSRETTWKKSSLHRVAVPGVAVGELRLGDLNSRAYALFPFKPGIDQEFQSGCGREINWVDQDLREQGNLFIHLQDNLVFQIDVATTRFRTVGGITVGESPEKVRAHYKGLRAYVLSDVTSEALGEGPLIYWVDRENGIAFAFAYSKTKRRRYLYEIVVFRPNSEICPMGDSINSPVKRELPPYSLDVPAN